MSITKVIRGLGLDPEHQSAMVHLVWSLCLSNRQKQKLFAAIMEEAKQEILPISLEIAQAIEKKEKPKSATILGQPFSPGWTGSPPGMSRKDLEIWNRYRTRDEKKILRVYYNVRVGNGTMPHHEAEPWYCLYWVLSTMLRIDVIAEKEDEVLIIEVRPDAGRSAFGAAIMYKYFWSLAPKIGKVARAILVTDNITTQVRSCCDDHNVAYNIV